LQKHLQRYTASSSSTNPSSSSPNRQQKQHHTIKNSSTCGTNPNGTSDSDTLEGTQSPTTTALSAAAVTATTSSVLQQSDDDCEDVEFQFSLKTQLISEIVGTYILTLIGFGGMIVSHYYDQYEGKNNSNHDNNIASTSVLWSVGTMIGIFLSASVSGGHLNPAVTLAFACIRPTAFDRRKIVPYIMAQIIGSFLAVCTLLLLYQQLISTYTNNVTSSTSWSKCSKTTKSLYDMVVLNGSQSTTRPRECHRLPIQCLQPFIGSSPSPPSASMIVNDAHAFFIEVFGSFMILFVIFSVTSTYYPIPGSAVPPVVASAIGVMIFLLGPLTGTVLNPCIEIGKRLASLLWIVGQTTSIQAISSTDIVRIFVFTLSGEIPVWSYIVGPMIGGPVGAWLAEYMQHMT
jgi:glycerol uptake facilitator protein